MRQVDCVHMGLTICIVSISPGRLATENQANFSLRYSIQSTSSLVPDFFLVCHLRIEANVCCELVIGSVLNPALHALSVCHFCMCHIAYVPGCVCACQAFAFFGRKPHQPAGSRDICPVSIAYRIILGYPDFVREVPRVAKDYALKRTLWALWAASIRHLM